MDRDPGVHREQVRLASRRFNGELLYACRYIIPSETFKIQASVNGHIVYCDVESVPADQVPPEVIDLGIEAGNAIGKGLYGVDIKESNGKLYVIEVNDNPSLEGGEDANYPDMFRNIVSYLMTRETPPAMPMSSWPRAIGPHGFEGEYGWAQTRPLPNGAATGGKRCLLLQDRFLREVDANPFFIRMDKS